MTTRPKRCTRSAGVTFEVPVLEYLHELARAQARDRSFCINQIIALDREEDATGRSWGITDGSAGLRGHVLRSDVLADVKLFLATFRSGMASGLQETDRTIIGTEFPATARNAALSGASSVLNRYAEQLGEVTCPMAQGHWHTIAACSEV